MLNKVHYLLDYLKNCDPESPVARHIEMLKIELDWHIYHYGEHFAFPKENKAKKKLRPYQQLKKIYRSWQIPDLKYLSNDRPNILSLIYFNRFNSNLEESGFNVVSPYWGPTGNKVIGTREIKELTDTINNCLSTQSFQYLIGAEFQDIVARFSGSVKALVKAGDFRALLLYTDQYFYSKIAIQMFREAGRLSAVLSHGLPAVYDPNSENSTDYLLVWGNAIRENYIKAGFDPSKVLVSGHPSYNPSATVSKLRFDFSDIVVLAKATSPHQHSYEPVISDRGNILIYLFMVRRVLEQLGVTRVRLRPHPTMSREWLLQFLGNDFFEVDVLPLHESLKKASLVIGPTSTVLLECLFNHVNYVAFEPADDTGRDLTGFQLVPPFDGSEPYLPVARTGEELLSVLKNKEQTDTRLLAKYLTPFDKSVLKKILS